MSYQQKDSIMSIFSTIIISGIYYMLVLQMHPEGNGPELLRYWGLMILLLIPVQIVAKIIISIVFIVINRIATREEEPSFYDELDKLINLKSTRNAFYGFILIFFVAMGMLALNMSITLMFNTLFFGLVLIGVIIDTSQLFYYRRGV